MRKLFEKACCFAGPESIPEEQERRIIARINHVMDRLISKEILLLSVIISRSYLVT